MKRPVKSWRDFSFMDFTVDIVQRFYKTVFQHVKKNYRFLAPFSKVIQAFFNFWLLVYFDLLMNWWLFVSFGGLSSETHTVFTSVEPNHCSWLLESFVRQPQQSMFSSGISDAYIRYVWSASHLICTGCLVQMLSWSYNKLQISIHGSYMGFVIHRELPIPGSSLSIPGCCTYLFRCCHVLSLHSLLQLQYLTDFRTDTNKI